MQLHQLLDAVEDPAQPGRLGPRGDGFRAPLGQHVDVQFRPESLQRPRQLQAIVPHVHRIRVEGYRPVEQVTQFRPFTLRAETEAVTDDHCLQLGIGEYGNDGILERAGLDQLVDKGIVDPAQPPDVVAQLLVAWTDRRP